MMDENLCYSLPQHLLLHMTSLSSCPNLPPVRDQRYLDPSQKGTWNIISPSSSAYLHSHQPTASADNVATPWSDFFQTCSFHPALLESLWTPSLLRTPSSTQCDEKKKLSVSMLLSTSVFKYEFLSMGLEIFKCFVCTNWSLNW